MNRPRPRPASRWGVQAGRTNHPGQCITQEGAPYGQTAAITGTRVMVTSGHIDASMAGCRLLARGGLVGDAAVAVQAMLAVVEPFASGLAAGSLATLYDAKTKQVRTIEGYSAAPGDVGVAQTPWQTASPDDVACRSDATLRPGVDQPSAVQGPINASMRAVGVPGTMRVLQRLHASAGKLPWPSLWSEAIATAESGAPMSPYMYSTMYSDGTDRVDEDGDLLPPGGVRAWTTSTRWGPYRCQFKDIRARYCDLNGSSGQLPLPVGTKIKQHRLAPAARVQLPPPLSSHRRLLTSCQCEELSKPIRRGEGRRRLTGYRRSSPDAESEQARVQAVSLSARRSLSTIAAAASAPSDWSSIGYIICSSFMLCCCSRSCRVCAIPR